MWYWYDSRSRHVFCSLLEGGMEVYQKLACLHRLVQTSHEDLDSWSSNSDNVLHKLLHEYKIC